MMFTPSAIVITVLSALTHPYGLLAVQLSAFGAAAFTKPTSSLRYAAIVVMVAAAYYFHLTVHDRMDNKMTKTLPAGITMGCTLSAIEKLLIGKWSYEIGGPEADRKKNNINGSVNSKKWTTLRPKSRPGRNFGSPATCSFHHAALASRGRSRTFLNSPQTTLHTYQVGEHSCFASLP